MGNLELMNKRLMRLGGIKQEDRMIQGKYETLQRALLYSYQGCNVQKVGERIVRRALINPDKVKQDYDDKILSIDRKFGYEPGDVFEWKGTDTHWLIYLEEITEDAYFRGEIRRCRYKIKFKDEEGNVCETWAAIRGPVETAIDSIQKNQIRIDNPNLSLNILMPRNKKTLAAFTRYKKFLFAGKAWKVEAPDSISMRNIIEVNAQEDYINEFTDDVEQEVKDGLVIAAVDPTPNTEILGETFIKPKIAETYTIDREGGSFSVAKGTPANLCAIDGKSVKVTWTKSTSGEFTLIWSDGTTTVEKTIVVESLF